MSQSLFAILRRRLVIVGLALTAASFAVVSFYYADWAAMRGEKLDEQVERIASVLQRDATGKLTASLSSRHGRSSTSIPRPMPTVSKMGMGASSAKRTSRSFPSD